MRLLVRTACYHVTCVLVSVMKWQSGNQKRTFTIALIASTAMKLISNLIPFAGFKENLEPILDTIVVTILYLSFNSAYSTV